MRSVPASTSVTTPRYLPKNRLRSRSITSMRACSSIIALAHQRADQRRKPAGTTGRRPADGVAHQHELHRVGIRRDAMPHAPDQVLARSAAHRCRTSRRSCRRAARPRAARHPPHLRSARTSRLPQHRLRAQRQFAGVIDRCAPSSTVIGLPVKSAERRSPSGGRPESEVSADTPSRVGIGEQRLPRDDRRRARRVPVEVERAHRPVRRIVQRQGCDRIAVERAAWRSSRSVRPGLSAQAMRQTLPLRRASMRRNWMSEPRCIRLCPSSVWDGESSSVFCSAA